MCGIAGIVTVGRPERAEETVERMVAASRHRGPNGSGMVTISMPSDAGHVVLGHTRLSIIDMTERASQPMHDARTGSWLVYNGEIYNFRELRRELGQSGSVFASEGDTEALLQALVTWGEAGLRRARGMFAFGFWDGCKQELLLARDPLGIKPLYYYYRRGLLLFASEVKVLQAAGEHDGGIDPIAVDSFLTYGAVLGPHSILQGVRELPPGTCLRISAPEEPPFLERSWSFSKLVGQRPSRMKFAEALSSVQHHFAKAVESHLVSDVPLAVLLSGGIDSTLVARVAAEHHSRVTLLTVDFPEEEFSELKTAAKTACQLGLRHEVVRLSGNNFEDLCTRALDSMDQPTIDGINTYVVSHASSSLGFRVLLSGLGGDELFGGYTTFRKTPQLTRWQHALRMLAKIMPVLRKKRIPWAKVAQAGTLHNLGEAYLLQRSIRWDGSSGVGLRDYVENRILAPLAADRPDDADAFLQIAQLELCMYMRNQLLRDADVFSMANSVELRVPFLDLDLVGSALRLPLRCHFDLQGGKRITRRLLKDMSGREPSRKKVGFQFPWRVWLQGPLKYMLFDTLLSDSLCHALTLDSAATRQLIQKFERNDPLIPWAQVWSLFVLLRWARTRVRQVSHVGQVCHVSA